MLRAALTALFAAAGLTAAFGCAAAAGFASAALLFAVRFRSRAFLPAS